jgi:methionine-rich copper-binding protein CopC
MKLQVIALVAALLFGSELCQAHAHLLASVPSEGAKLATPPPHLELSFSEAARLTAASVRRGAEKPQSLPLPASAPAPAQHITLDLPALAPGSYAFDYRVISADGHIASGTVHFTVTAGASAAH